MIENFCYSICGSCDCSIVVCYWASVYAACYQNGIINSNVLNAYNDDPVYEVKLMIKQQLLNVIHYTVVSTVSISEIHFIGRLLKMSLSCNIQMFRLSK